MKRQAILKLYLPAGIGNNPIPGIQQAVSESKDRICKEAIEGPIENYLY